MLLSIKASLDADIKHVDKLLVELIAQRHRHTQHKATIMHKLSLLNSQLSIQSIQPNSTTTNTLRNRELVELLRGIQRLEEEAKKVKLSLDGIVEEICSCFRERAKYERQRMSILDELQIRKAQKLIPLNEITPPSSPQKIDDNVIGRYINEEDYQMLLRELDSKRNAKVKAIVMDMKPILAEKQEDVSIGFIQGKRKYSGFEEFNKLTLEMDYNMQ